MELKDLSEGNFYHVCTDGNSCSTLMREESDFLVEVNYTAISAWKTSLQIIAYCIMANHFHFLVLVRNREEVTAFIALFKRMFSMYFQKKYRVARKMTTTCALLISE